MLRRDESLLQLGRPSDARSSSPREGRSGVEKDESRGSNEDARSDDIDDSRSSDEMAAASPAASTHQATPLWASLGRWVLALYNRRGDFATMRAKKDLRRLPLGVLPLGVDAVLGMKSCRLALRFAVTILGIAENELGQP